MKKFLFNYCIPREYKDRETGEIKHAIVKGDEKMLIGTLQEIQSKVEPGMEKNMLPWLQIFDNGYRVTTKNIDHKDWNGMTQIDIDSKYYYDYCKPFDVDKLLKKLLENGSMMFYDNFYCIHLTNSKKGYRIFWYWDCERTEENYNKCTLLTERFTRELFYSLGDHAKEILDYKGEGHKVFDRCTKSVFQGSYMTKNEILYSEFIDTDTFGKCMLEDISLEQVQQTSQVIKLKDGTKQSDYASFISKKPIDKSGLRYFPHSHRRCIYEALIALFNDKEKVDKEWEYIAGLIPETGHTKEFYLKEPDKNKWYERFDDKVYHNIDWLTNFGYKYSDKSEYIYKKQFEKSWRSNCLRDVHSLYVNEMAQKKREELEASGLKKKDKEAALLEYQEKLLDSIAGYGIFDKFFDKSIKEEANKDKLDDIRKRFYDIRWEAKDFKRLCNGYSIPNDIVTYKMYADFYYRDANNMPLLKYNVLEDEIMTYGYWPETNKHQWHTFKFGNEYTHWKNNDAFCNKASKADLTEAVSKYVPRWHSYHSIKDYLKSLIGKETNEELLETWAVKYFKCEDTPYIREICKKWFIAAVKKMFVEDPTSFVFQHMLFLQGATGCGKTFFLVNMFTIDGHSYIINKLDVNGKDNEIGPLIGKNWLIQFGESENLKKVSVNAAKEFMDRINLGFKYQKKYENEQTTLYPRVIACRTSNDDVLFNDVSISEGDRRNWLIVCKTEKNACDENMRKMMKEDKDIIWATAMKLYMENPDMDLELSNAAFDELAKVQEDFKMIKDNDIEEIYNEIFDRMYLTNGKGCIQDEAIFNKMLEHSDWSLKNDKTYVMGFLDNDCYVQESKITKIPARWLNAFVTKKYGINYSKLLKKYLKEHKWADKPARYNDRLTRCMVFEGT